jgi:tankyrase
MNAKLVKLLGRDQTMYPHQLDMRFARIVDKIADLWGKPEMEPYFNDLMVDKRGNRQGFPPTVMMEIFALSNYYHNLQPARPRSVDTWSDSADVQRLERRGQAV